MIIKVCKARQSAAAGTAGGLPQRRASDENLGRSMGGLVRYLVGPGKANEHTNPRLVAASEPLFTEFADTDFEGEWATADTKELVGQLNRPMRDKRAADELPQDRGYVFHAVLSQPAGEPLSLDTWHDIAQDYVGHMGFDDSEGKAPCRWAAVHHGLSTDGNDHIHIAVMMIREDGTWASNFKTYQRSMRARRAIDAKYGLVPAEQAALTKDRVPYVMADVHAQVDKELGRDELRPGRPTAGGRRPQPDNDRLRRVMVAAATQSESEADYVRTLWRGGVLTSPRYAKGTTDVVTGYSVALRLPDGKRSQWRAAGTVHDDLRLSRLREHWEDTPQTAADAAQVWRTYKGERVPTPQPLKPLSTAAAQAAANIEALNGVLARLDSTDRGAWAAVSREAAGTLAQASTQHERDRGGPLGDASEALWRDASLHRRDRPLPKLPAHMGMARSIRLLAQASSPHDALGWVAVLEQLSHTLRAIKDAHQARQSADRAEYLAQHHAALSAVTLSVPTANPQQSPRTEARGHDSGRPESRPIQPYPPDPGRDYGR